MRRPGSGAVTGATRHGTVGRVHDDSPWRRLDGGVAALGEAVGCFAFSPADRYLAWADRATSTRVHITELDSLRGVCSIDAPGAFSLAWQGEEALRVVRLDGGALVFADHAVPDGGEVHRLALPARGAVAVEHAVDGRAALVTPSRIAYGRHNALRWVGAHGADDVLDAGFLDLWGEPRRRLGYPGMCASLSPDGSLLALGAGDGAAASGEVRFVTRGGERVGGVETTGAPAGLAWASGARLIATLREPERTALVAVDRAGGCARLMDLARGFVVASVEASPDRERALVVGSVEIVGGIRVAAAAVVRLDGGDVASVSLSGRVAPRAGGPLGAACWGPDGEVVTLTHDAARVATLSRHASTDAEPMPFARFVVGGGGLRDDALTASRTRRWVAATWWAHDTDGVTTRRLVLART